MVPDGIMPDVKPVSPTTSLASSLTPDAGAVSALGSFVWPASGRISQGYRFYHQAIDIANRGGGPILAADSGRVIVAGWPDNVGYGNRVMLDHGNGYITLYAHMSRISVVVGQSVNRGAHSVTKGRKKRWKSGIWSVGFTSWCEDIRATAIDSSRPNSARKVGG